MAKEALDKSLFIRCSQEDLDRLDAVSEATSGLVGRTSLARAAMRLGLDLVERDRSILFGQPVAKRGGKRTGAGRKARAT